MGEPTSSEGAGLPGRAGLCSGPQHRGWLRLAAEPQPASEKARYKGKTGADPRDGERKLDPTRGRRTAASAAMAWVAGPVGIDPEGKRIEWKDTVQGRGIGIKTLAA